MSRNKWTGVALAAVILVGAVAWYFASPYYTLMKMRDAANANNADALSAYIDYDSLREDLKSELMAHMMVEAQKDESGFGAFGVALGSAMIGPIVDGMVSPAGVRAMLISKRHEKAVRGATPKAPVKVGEDPAIERRSFSEFAVKSKSDADGALIFTRRGLGWKLSGVDFPPPGQE